MPAPKKVLIANLKGPPGDPGPQGDPGELDIPAITAVVETRMNDVPDLTLIFENQLL